MLRFPGLRPAAEIPIRGRFLKLQPHLEWDKEKCLRSSPGSPRLSLSESVTFIIFGRLNLNHRDPGALSMLPVPPALYGSLYSQPQPAVQLSRTIVLPRRRHAQKRSRGNHSVHGRGPKFST